MHQKQCALCVKSALYSPTHPPACPPNHLPVTLDTKSSSPTSSLLLLREQVTRPATSPWLRELQPVYVCVCAPRGGCFNPKDDSITPSCRFAAHRLSLSLSLFLPVRQFFFLGGAEFNYPASILAKRRLSGRMAGLTAPPSAMINSLAVKSQKLPPPLAVSQLWDLFCSLARQPCWPTTGRIRLQDNDTMSLQLFLRPLICHPLARY